MSVDVISLGISLQALQNATPGWSPAIAIVSDGARRVVKIHDWVGGGGQKPAAGLYVGASGLSPNIADGIDIRGPVGSGDVAGPGAATNGAIVLFDGATGKLLKSGSVVPSTFGLSLLDDVDQAAAQTTLGLVPGTNVQTPSQVDAKLAAYQPLAQKGVANGYAGLDAGGKLLASVLPALAITDIFEVASQAAMLALTAQVGDIAIRTDLSKTFGLAAEPATTLANWKELRTPTDVVQSVAGLTGTITAAALKLALALGTAAASAASDFATAAQGAKADAALPNADLDTPRVWAKRQRSTPLPLTSATAITVDLALSQDFDVAALAHSTVFTFTNTANAIDQKGSITGRNNATGGFTVGYGAGANPIGRATAPAIPSGANDRWRIDYHVRLDGTVDFSVLSVGV